MCINCRDDERCDGNDKLVMQSGWVGYSQGMPIPILYPSSRNPAFHSTCTVVSLGVRVREFGAEGGGGWQVKSKRGMEGGAVYALYAYTQQCSDVRCMLPGC